MLLTIDDLTVRYGLVTAVDHVSLLVDVGEAVAVIGANGAGKSSLLRAIAGLTRATGEIRLGGAQVVGMAADDIARRGVRLIPEGGAVFRNLTVDENLAVGWPGGGAAARSARIRDMYDRFPALGQRRGEKGATLSGGERQMLAIARAIMSQPQLLLFDEPSFGLAPLVVKQVFDLIADLRTEGAALLVVEQNAHQALAVADRGYVLERGAVQLEGLSGDLRQDPLVVSYYLGETR